ncbi:hypothetical protein DRE_01880 [Drechslerella stenobrocha 248]|uniref:Uncharacterized protein n=1 Tax=Drechslerella stenobrocha 248 TaxID=1043628 RepID=W7I8M2_9PEZI|nr:hypothetical protein DRE_01880 [Drechslerella stenobrocha 248]
MADHNSQRPESGQGQPLGLPEHPDRGEISSSPPPSYEIEHPAGGASAPAEFAQDVKYGSDGWPSEPLSQIPTATSDLHAYNPNSGIVYPSTTSYSSGPASSISHTTSRHHHLSVPNHDHEDAVPPPAYSEVGGSYQNVEIDQNGFQSKARMLDDGRIDISINQRSRRFSNILLPALSQTMTHMSMQVPPLTGPGSAAEFNIPKGLQGKDVPKLNIVIQIIGSRGDVQPFVALGKVLRNNPPYHRVRVATHPTFHKFVVENGLEFFSIGGDPAELMAFMVKNPGLMPGWDSLRQGDVGKRRKAMYELLMGCWRSCIEGGDGMNSMGNQVAYPKEVGEGAFIADAIIANPPSFAHIHCAERLAIPLHLMFTMPWTPTQSFPHPLANIRSSNTEANITNFLSYTMVDLMTWQGLGDLVNKFREKTLGLDPVSTMWAPGMILRLKVPHTYCWSPALIPKPEDWGEHIRISGFYFLDLANNYTPAADLAAFLDDGPPPVYIGFGSIVVDDPNRLTDMIFEAVKLTGVRALVSKGWGGLGGDSLQVPENVFMLGNCPHDWLFKKVACVVHHGGAGTTAIGVALGKPTVIVPFFGDQPFWGSMVHRAGAGPQPVPFKELTAQKLAQAILFAMSPEAQAAAGTISEKVKQETGTISGSDSFHASLDKQRLKCLVDPRRTAVWRVKRTEVRLSAVAAAFLHQEGLLYYSDLKLCRHQEWQTSTGPIEPISGGASALLGTIGSVMMGVGDVPMDLFRAAKQTHNSKDDATSETNSIMPATPVSATSNNAPLLPLSDSAALSSKRSFDSGRESGRDSELTSLSSYNMTEYDTRGQSKEQLPGIPGPSDTSTPATIDRNNDGYPAASDVNPTLAAASNPDLNTGSHRTAMAAAMGDVQRARSTSPLRKWRHGKAARSQTDIPGSRGRSTSPVRRKLHKERSAPVEHPMPHRTPTDRTSETVSSDGTKTPKDTAANIEKWLGAGKGAGKIAGAVMKSPLDFSLAVAQGFRNAPLLYGDTTVRKQDKITGMGSGLKVAGKEFAFGLYDGISGFVTQPVKGAREEGQLGFLKGIGRGVGGLILKPGAAVWGLPGYTFKGIYEEVRKHAAGDMNGYIVAARIAQGMEELAAYQPAELETMVKRWNALNVERVKGRSKHKDEKGKSKEKGVKDHSKKKRFGCPGKQEVSVEAPADEVAQAEEDIADAPENRYHPVMRSAVDVETMNVLSSAAGYQQPLPPPPNLPPRGQLHANRTLQGLENHREIEQAIQQSVQQTSRGDPEEDRMIENAIRTSLAEVVTQGSEEDDDLVLRRAITASLETTGADGHDEAHAQALQEAVTKSLTESYPTPDHLDAAELELAIEESKNPQHDAQANQELELALQLSRQEEANKREQDESEEDLRLALEISKQEEEQKRKEKEEEEVVMNYVMKMSLAEQKFKQPMIPNEGGPSSSSSRAVTAGSSTNAEQEQLAKAIHESLKHT